MILGRVEERPRGKLPGPLRMSGAGVDPVASVVRQARIASPREYRSRVIAMAYTVVRFHPSALSTVEGPQWRKEGNTMPLVPGLVVLVCIFGLLVALPFIAARPGRRDADD